MLGRECYDTFSDRLSYTILPGDLAFAQALGSIDLHLSKTKVYKEINEETLRELPQIQECAVKFIENLVELIVKDGCDLVGLNLTFQIAPALALARGIYKRSKRPWIIIGGGNCEAGMGEALIRQLPWIDFVCRGEGEELIVNLLKILSMHDTEPGSRTWTKNQRQQLSNIQGLVWRDSNRIIKNDARARGPKDLDDLPIPIYGPWLEEVKSSNLGIRKEQLSITFETSRGCWYGEHAHCTFCGLNGPSLVFRSKSSERVINEITGLADHGIPFAESTDLILDFSYFKHVIPSLAMRKSGPSLYFETKANLTLDHLVALKNARINTIQPGIESLDSAILTRMRKGVAGFQNIRLLRDCSELGITVDWSLLFGFPNEEPESYYAMSQRIPLIEHLQPPTGGCVPIVLNRFSPLFEKADHFGIRALRPLPAYYEVFGGIFSDVSQVAYFFEGEMPEESGIHSAHEKVIERVAMWKTMVGSSALISLDDPDGTTLLDYRQCAVQERAYLEGDDRDVFLACRNGVSIRVLEKTLHLTLESICKCLEFLMDSRWVLELDDRFISLAVRGEPLLPPSTPDILKEPAVLAAYRSRARILSNVY